MEASGQHHTPATLTTWKKIQYPLMGTWTQHTNYWPRGDEQNNGNSCERYTFLYSYGAGPPFACNTACILVAIDSCTFWIVCSGILYPSSWRTSSSCLRDDGKGNLLLALLSKTDHSGSIYLSLLITLAREDELHPHAPQNQTEHFWLYMCKLSSWKIASLLGNNIWTTGFTRSPKMSTQSLAVIWPFRAILGPAENRNIAAQIITDQLPCFTLGL